jgi:hypothetical protein
MSLWPCSFLQSSAPVRMRPIVMYTCENLVVTCTWHSFVGHLGRSTARRRAGRLGGRNLRCILFVVILLSVGVAPV